MFSQVCVCSTFGVGGTPSQVWRGGYPISGLDGGIPHPMSGQGGIPSQVWKGGPHPRSWWGVPHPRSGWGDTPSQVWEGTPFQVWTGGYLISGLDGRIPHPRSRQGGTPSQVWKGGPHPRSWWGVPHPRSGWGDTPSQVWGGTPFQVWMGGYPIPGLDRGVPLSRSGSGVLHPRSGQGGYPIQGLVGGYPILLTGWWGVPHSADRGYAGYPPCPRLDGVPPLSRPGSRYPPLLNQQNEHLLRGGRCASCVHAGGLSCKI